MITKRSARTCVRVLTLTISGLVAGCGPRMAVGGGLGAVKFDVGGESTRTVEPLLAARLFVRDSGAGGGLVLDLKPVPTRNPVWNESVSSLIILPSLFITDGRAGLRLGIGPTANVWTGNTTEGTYSWGVVAGGALFVKLQRRRPRPLAVELFATSAGELETSALIVGVQLLKYVR